MNPFLQYRHLGPNIKVSAFSGLSPLPLQTGHLIFPVSKHILQTYFGLTIHVYFKRGLIINLGYKLPLSWTSWKCLADNNEIFDLPEYSGSGCYVLGFGGSRRGNFKTRYIGETSDIRRRMNDHASGRSHCNVRILMELRQGYYMFYRYTKTRSKPDAKKIQDTLCDRYPEKFPWNGNC